MSNTSLNVPEIPSRRTELVAFVGWAFILAMVLLVFTRPHLGSSREALYRTEIARDLLQGSTRGRQGLVGSLKVAPLPTIIVSLVSAALYVTPSLWISCLLAGGFALGLCLYANRLWARAGISPYLRYPAITALLFVPSVAVTIAEGRTTMLFTGCIVAGLGFCVHWLERFDLRDLAYAALLLGCSVVIRYQGVYIVVGSLAVVFCASVMKKQQRGLVEGTAVTFATPAVYVVLLWGGGNWLILGDPFFFLHGLIKSAARGTGGVRALLGAPCDWATLGCVALLVLSVPLCRALCRAPRGGWVVHLAAVVGLMAAATWGGSMWVSTEDDVPYNRITRTVSRLETKYPNGSFIVTGYEGYEFKQAAGPDPERAWIHMMHLEDSKLRKILDDFEGRRMFLLVNTNESVDKWQRLGLEWKSPRSRIPDRFLYAEKESSWVVFEVLREAT